MNDRARFMSAAKPLYKMGDLVFFRLECEEGFIFCSAYVVGIYKEPHKLEDDWNYKIKVISPDNLYCDELAENEILGQVIHGTENRDREVRAQVGCSAVGAFHQGYRLGVG